jgi:signal transduction histidine kinase/ligand-binding sensor domain-containing protein
MGLQLCSRLGRWFAVALFVALLSLGLSGAVLAQDSATSPADPGAPPPFSPPAPIRFEHLSLEDGLSQNAVLDLLQDRQGFLWVATQDGLNRYDGYSFKVFKTDPDDPNTLSINSVLKLLEDDAGNIWVGTWGGGLNRLDPQTGAVRRYRYDEHDPASLSNDLVAALWEDGHGSLWVGTMGGGLNRLDRISGRFTRYRHDPADPTSIGSDFVSSIYEDEHGALWLGTGGFGNPGAGLDRFDPQSETFTHYHADPTDPHTLSSDSIAAVYPAPDGKLWLGTGGFGIIGAGLNLFDPATGQVTRLQHDETDPTSLANNTVMSIFTDSEGRTWVGTWGGGLDLVQRDGDAITFLHHRNDPYELSSLSADIVWPMLEDTSGVLWVGTVNGGINKVNPQMQRFGLYRNHPDNPQSLGFNVVGSFYEDRAGGIWVGTWGGGLNLFDRAAGTFTRYLHDPNDPTSLSEKTVSAVYEDPGGAIWVGTFGGLNKLDRTTGEFTHYRHDPADPDSVASDSIYTLLAAPEGKMWVGLLGGLDLYDPATDTFRHFVHDPNEPSSLPDNDITELYADRTGRLWIGTWHNGMAYLDPDAWARGEARFVRYEHDPDDPATISDNGVWAIHQDRTGAIWAGTQAGLNRLDLKTGRFTHYREKDGLPNSSVTCIQEDEGGNLWLGTNNGLVRVNPILMRFRTYDVSNGLQSNEFNSGACLRSRSGEMFYGGVRGFNVFQPGEVRDNPNPPPVVITGFQVFNKPQPVDLSGQQPIDLSYEQNFISFEFAALDFHAPYKNRYAYRLEGFDPEWIQAGDRRYASYTNLPPGSYTFRVRGSNNDGVWNEAGLALPLRVAPPLWQTWWFQASAILLVASLAFAGYRWRVHEVRVQNRRLAQTVAQQTADLRHEMEQRRQAEEALAHKAAEEAARDAVIAERTRLARDLHDAVTQTLFSASLIAEVLPDLYSIDPQEGKESTEELRQLTRGALAEMRTLLLELRPAAVMQARLDDLVRQLIEAIVGRTRLPVQYDADGQRPLPDDVKVALYRIAQEALNNVVKYARPKQVTVDLRQHPLGVRLTVADDGVGFDPAAVGAGHLGQKIMRERAEAIGARISVHSKPGEGTVVTVIWLDPECPPDGK